MELGWRMHPLLNHQLRVDLARFQYLHHPHMASQIRSKTAANHHQVENEEEGGTPGPQLAGIRGLVPVAIPGANQAATLGARAVTGPPQAAAMAKAAASKAVDGADTVDTFPTEEIVEVVEATTMTTRRRKRRHIK